MHGPKKLRKKAFGGQMARPAPCPPSRACRRRGPGGRASGQPPRGDDRRDRREPSHPFVGGAARLPLRERRERPPTQSLPRAFEFKRLLLVSVSFLGPPRLPKRGPGKPSRRPPPEGDRGPSRRCFRLSARRASARRLETLLADHRLSTLCKCSPHSALGRLETIRTARGRGSRGDPEAPAPRARILSSAARRGGGGAEAPRERGGFALRGACAMRRRLRITHGGAPQRPL